jgi:hypothetical protein
MSLRRNSVTSLIIAMSVLATTTSTSAESNQLIAADAGNWTFGDCILAQVNPICCCRR